MKCKYCNKEMNCESETDNIFEIFKCECNATCIIQINTKEEIWHDGKPPRAECLESFLGFKEGSTYRIIDADLYQVMVVVNRGTDWINKDDKRFKIFM